MLSSAWCVHWITNVTTAVTHIGTWNSGSWGSPRVWEHRTFLGTLRISLQLPRTWCACLTSSCPSPSHLSLPGRPSWPNAQLWLCFLLPVLLIAAWVDSKAFSLCRSLGTSTPVCCIPWDQMRMEMCVCLPSWVQMRMEMCGCLPSWPGHSQQSLQSLSVLSLSPLPHQVALGLWDPPPPWPHPPFPACRLHHCD